MQVEMGVLVVEWGLVSVGGSCRVAFGEVGELDVCLGVGQSVVWHWGGPGYLMVRYTDSGREPGRGSEAELRSESRLRLWGSSEECCRGNGDHSHRIFRGRRGSDGSSCSGWCLCKKHTIGRQC